MREPTKTVVVHLSFKIFAAISCSLSILDRTLLLFSQLSSLEAAMKNALEKGRTEFVELLLEHGVNMANFLNKDRLEGLYSSVSTNQ